MMSCDEGLPCDDEFVMCCGHVMMMMACHVMRVGHVMMRVCRVMITCSVPGGVPGEALSLLLPAAAGAEARLAVPRPGGLIRAVPP